MQEKYPIIWLANPMGFCAGVKRAIAIVEKLLAEYGPPIYVRHAIVHNEWVTQSLESKGAIFVESCSQVPTGARIVFSAHGVSPCVYRDAKARSLTIYDATCPLVHQVHRHVRYIAQSQQALVMIGDASHVEVQGTIGQYRQHSQYPVHIVQSIADAEKIMPVDPDALGFATQTTLCVAETQSIIHALRRRFPMLQGPEKGDVCYATTNRQTAVHQLIQRGIECLIILSSLHSSNGKKLVHIGKNANVPTLWIDNPETIRREQIGDAQIIGMSAAASTPQTMIDVLIKRMRQWDKYTLRVMHSTLHEPQEFALSVI